MDISSSSYAPSSPASQSPKQRRRSAALSCAECRRLKLRCSRVFPCTSCVKKGCAAICPKDSLTTGKGNRFILANTEALHEKISELCNRVRQLEDALAEAHLHRTADRHPLLSDELLMIKRPLERETKSEQVFPAQSQSEPETEEAIDAVGSLAISESGKSNFFGMTASSWHLLQNEVGNSEDVIPEEDIPLLNRTFPFTLPLGETVEEVRAMIFNSLPERTAAQQLIDVYYRHAGWMYRPVEPDDLWNNIFDRVYDSEALADFDPIQSHKIAVVYMMLALGALLDLGKAPYSKEANKYYQLARAALAVDSVFEEQSIPAVQALVLMCHYMFFAEIDGPRWALMGLVVKLAQSVGLHRDSGRWNLDSVETKRRRSLLWEIVTYDSWQSLTYGRPPSFSMLHIDCQMAHSPIMNDRGEEELSFELWKHRFVSQCLSIVHDQAFGARIPNYRVIQDLDRKVRSFLIPMSLQVPGFGGQSADVAPPTVSITLQRYTAFAIREMTIFYMHRGFFAKALEESPGDPLSNRFAPSVLAAHNSACSFVGLVQSLFTQHPRLSERLWFLFTHVFSCAIVLGSIAIKCPGIALARSAASHLETAARLFEAVRTGRASKVIPVLLKLCERASMAMQEAFAKPSLTPPRSTPEREKDIIRENEELATLGGRTRLVPRKSTAASTPSSPASNSGSSASPNSLPFTITQLPPGSYSSPTIPNIALPQSTYGQAPSAMQHSTSQLQHPVLSPLLPQHSMPSPADVTRQWPAYAPPAVTSPITPSSYHATSSMYSVDNLVNVMDYTAYTLPPEPWQNAPSLNPSYATASQPEGHAGNMYAGDQYLPPSFDLAASMRTSPYSVGSGAPQLRPSSTPTNELGAASDPTAAWHTLVSQFGHT